MGIKMLRSADEICPIEPDQGRIARQEVASACAGVFHAKPHTCTRDDIGRVGGKNASLGEMMRTLAPKGIRIPPGFATTAEAYWNFLKDNGFVAAITDLLEIHSAGKATLADTGRAIRTLLLHGGWPETLRAASLSAYRELCERTGSVEVDVGGRSATGSAGVSWSGKGSDAVI